MKTILVLTVMIISLVARAQTDNCVCDKCDCNGSPTCPHKVGASQYFVETLSGCEGKCQVTYTSASEEIIQNYAVDDENLEKFKNNKEFEYYKYLSNDVGAQCFQ